MHPQDFILILKIESELLMTETAKACMGQKKWGGYAASPTPTAMCMRDSGRDVHVPFYVECKLLF